MIIEQVGSLDSGRAPLRPVERPAPRPGPGQVLIRVAAWIGSACGECARCKEGRENLCDAFLAHGRDLDGGYAELMLAHADFTHAIPATFSDVEAAPLLCAGAVGYRALRLSGIVDGANLGFAGFGASARRTAGHQRHQQG